MGYRAIDYRAGVMEPAQTENAVLTARPVRRPYRQKIRTLAYVTLDDANGGIIRDLSETGVAVQAVIPLRMTQEVQLRLELVSPRVRFETVGRVAWADATGQAGLEFLDVPERARRLLKEWLFTQLLATAHEPLWDSIFIHERDEEATELLFSAAPRPAIQIEPEQPPVAPTLQVEPEENRAGMLHLSWCPVAITPSSLARLVDSLVLLSAVLLFSVVALAMTQVFPTWPIALAIALGITSTFAFLYWVLFEVWIGTTPGLYLARIAGSDTGNEMHLEEEDRPRFR